MTIELTTRAAAHALATYLENCGCSVEFADACVLKVEAPPRSQTPYEAEVELNAYLRVWRLLHPSHEFRRIDRAHRPRSA